MKVSKNPEFWIPQTYHSFSVNRPVRMSLEMVGAGAGVEEVAVEDRVALPLLILHFSYVLTSYINAIQKRNVS